MEAIEAEIHKLIEYSFIREGQYSGLLILYLYLRRMKKIMVCIDFRDINIACPKDEYLLPITDIMIDNRCGFERMSFMDGFSRYKQNEMHPDDENHTSFRTPFRIFCYKVMPSGLKNAGPTY